MSNIYCKIMKPVRNQLSLVPAIFLPVSQVTDTMTEKMRQHHFRLLFKKHKGHQPSKGPFSETSSASSGSCSRSMLSEYESDWPPLTVGTSSPAGAEAHNRPAAEVGTGSPLLKPLTSKVPCPIKSACCCFCKAAWNGRKTRSQQEFKNQTKDINKEWFLQCR